jgi:hypothetical protein
MHAGIKAKCFANLALNECFVKNAFILMDWIGYDLYDPQPAKIRTGHHRYPM